jgi:hypothetical protein
MQEFVKWTILFLLLTISMPGAPAQTTSSTNQQPDR